MIKEIAYIIVVIFGFIGSMFVGTIIHELSHKEDYKLIALNGNICLLELEELRGYYRFSYDSEYKEDYNRISQYTEIKAYFLDGFVFLLFISALIISGRLEN